MKRFIICILLCTPVLVFSQYKIAVVSATAGQTKICPTLDSAYNTAGSGDYIYLPAGSFTLSQSVKKKINIYGAGIDPDSSLMGISSIYSVTCEQGSEGSYFEGFKVEAMMLYNHANNKVSDITFQRCNINSIGSSTGSPQIRSERVSFYECVINSISAFGYNWKMVKTIVLGSAGEFESSTFINNIFANRSGSVVVYNTNNSTFSNNVFLGFNNSNAPTNSIFYNNINSYGTIGNTVSNLIINNIAVSGDQIFLSESSTWYQSNYHLKPGCPGIGAGTDGTDIGIYGTSQPTKLGWIPSNPHVYFKNVAGQNNSSGVLNATFKVKSQSN